MIVTMERSQLQNVILSMEIRKQGKNLFYQYNLLNGRKRRQKQFVSLLVIGNRIPKCRK